MLRRMKGLLGILLFFITLSAGCDQKEPILNRDREFYNERLPLPESQIRLTVLGDIMFHHTQLYRAWVPSQGDFDFRPSFEPVLDYLREGHICIGNLETTLAGPMGALLYDPDTHVRGYQAYPTFNSPNSVADALKYAGIDVALTSNNHTMDSGIPGVDSTLAQLRRVGILSVGTSEVPHSPPLYIQVDGISLAIINWSYGTNGISIPLENLDRVNSLQDYNEERIQVMLDQLAEAESSGADWVVATIHFGPEYHTEPHGPTQEDIVERLIQGGADLILGSHPHVLQPMEIRERQLETGETEDVFIIYSMGNFLASQPWREHRPWETDNSIILNLDLAQDSQGRNRLAGIEIIPIYTQWTREEIRVVPVEYALSDQGSDRLRLSSEDQARLPHIQNYVPSHMLSRLPGFSWLQEGDRYQLVFPQEDSHETFAD